MRYTFNDILEVLSESTSESLYNDHPELFIEGYKKDPRKKELSDEYRRTHKSTEIVDRDNSTVINRQLTNDEGKRLKKLTKIMCKNNINNDTHAAAVNMFNRTIGSPKDSSVTIVDGKVNGRKVQEPFSMSRQGKGYVIDTVTHKSGKEIQISSTDKLYHISKVDNLTELNPTNRSTDGVHHTSKRIYFYLNRTGTKMGGKLDADDHVYELINPPSTVKIDNELAKLSKNTAVYIETDKPLKVKKVK